MRLLYKLISKKLLSLYGISIAGSAASALVQIGLASLYIGKGTFSLLGPMLIFNTISGLITAFLCDKLKLKENLSFTKMPETEAASQSPQNRTTPALQIILAILLLSLSASIFFIKNLIVLTCAFVLSLIAQKLCKRKIFIIPHLSLWLFIFISMIFVPNGEVIFKFWIISITKGSLSLALQKALILSTVSALSQCAVCLKPGRNTLLGLSFEYYRLMIKRFAEKDGSLINKIIYSLNINSKDSLSSEKQSQ
jgi:heptaprenyl diphosphate synthase